MSSFETDFAYSQQFIGAMRGIAAQHLITAAPLAEDLERATDLIVLQAGTIRIACRVRRPEAIKYADQFTIRSRLDNGAKTELRKIFDGWGHYLIYGFGDEEGDGLTRWLLGDLEVFRSWFDETWDATKEVPGMEIDNGDGTRFRAFVIDDLPPEFVIARK